MTFKENIASLITKRLSTYQNDPEMFKSRYTEEKRITEDYNGRQLLELLQNADDAKASEVLIEWDKREQTLKISNTGEGFSIRGISSLMLPSTSTKKGKVFIGNKGLGFRSILNWANVVNIYCNDCKIVFSEEIAAKVFHQKLKLSASDKLQLQLDCDLNEGGIPFPVLGIPEVTLYDNANWATTIELEYKKDYEDKISNQIDELKEEIILFLNNIRSLQIIIDGELKKEIICKKHPKNHKEYSLMEIGSKKWNVFDSGEVELPSEYQDKKNNTKESYSLKIAIDNNLNDDYKRLFNYFPTKVKIDLPCIIHGTFDISSNRDHLNQSKKNDFIIEQLPALFIKCIEKLKADGLNWNAYKLITPSNQNPDSQEIKNLYGELDNLRNDELAIYPTISGQYEKFTDVVFYGNDFSAFAKEHFPKVMPKLIMPLQSDINEVFFEDKVYEAEYFTKLLDSIPLENLSIPNRALLIEKLTSINKVQRTSLLIDKYNKKIPKNEVSFTPRKQSEVEYGVPKYAKIHFINSELYEYLIEIFKESLDVKERDRELKRKIDKVVYIQAYDSTTILERILTKTRQVIEKTDSDIDKVKIVKEMVKKLFANFETQDSERRKIDKLKQEIFLVNREDKLVMASDLYLGRTYKSGKITESIYSDSISEFYLADSSFWDIQNPDENKLEDFFLWLGVNQYAKTGLAIIDHSEWKFIEFAKRFGDLEVPTDYNADRLDGNEMISISNFNLVKSLPITNILLLCLVDPTIKDELQRRHIEIKWSYSRLKKSTHTNCSYIRYQFNNSDLFSNLIIDDSVKELKSLLSSDLVIDYGKLSNFGYEEHEVKSILLKLGANNSIESLSSAALYDILKNVPSQFSVEKIRGVQSIYKLIADVLENKDEEYEIPQDLELFAKLEGENVLLNAAEVYYSNNTLLPKKIMDTLPILYYPKRSGEEKLEKYFGIKIIEASNIKLDEASIASSRFNEDFQIFFEALKPLILTYRLYSKNLKKEINNRESIQENVGLIKNCKILLVDECDYYYRDSNKRFLDCNDFIKQKNVFYLRPPLEKEFKDLVKNSELSDAFSEILSVHFDVSELKNDFRILFRNELQDSRHLIRNDFDDDKIAKINEYMGIPAVEVSFWSNIFLLKNKKLPENISRHEQLIQSISDQLRIDVKDKLSKVNFEFCDNLETFNFISFIAKDLGIAIENFYPHGLLKWHEEQLLNAREDFENVFKAIVWDNLCLEKSLQQSFLSKIDKYVRTPIGALLPAENKYILIINYKELLYRWVAKNLKIDLDSTHTANHTPVIQYGDLLRKYNFDRNSIDNDRILSLLYFEGNEEQIEQYLIENTVVVDPNNEAETESEDDDNTEVIIVELSSDLNNGPSVKRKEKGKKKRKTHSKKEDEQKELKGKEAEIKVFANFKKQYGEKNVKWVSSYSDTTDKDDNLQYDIKYRDESGTWKHVEVKSLSNNSFILSNPEKEHGIKQKGKYELALVDGVKIYRVFNPFNFENGESFDSNRSFTASPKDYTLHFKILKK
jgi:hypothetical protein